MSAAGAGFAVRVNLASVPSVTNAADRLTLTSGLFASSALKRREPGAARTPPSIPLGVSVPRATVRASFASLCGSRVTFRLIVAEGDAPAPPVNVIVGGLVARFALARLA